MKSGFQNRREESFFAYIALFVCCFWAGAQGIDEETNSFHRNARDYSCGDGLTCEIENNVFYVKGSGSMANYSYSPHTPWYDQRSYVGAVYIEEGVTSIGDYAFYEFDYLTDVSIGGDVSMIGSHAFDSCVRLVEISIPESVTTIGPCAFCGCSSLKNISIGKNVKTIDMSALSGCTSLADVVIPNSVTTLGKYAFSGCKNLKSVTISNSVTKIEVYSFQSCGNLISVTIPDSVGEIEEYAFQSCVNLTKVSIGNSVRRIAYRAFDKCERLTSFTVKKENKYYASRKGVLFDKSLSELILYPSSLVSDSSIVPDSVRIIGNYSFEYCTGLKNLAIPESVTIIADYAFYKSSLISVTIGDGVKTIGQCAFNYCQALTTVTIGNNVKFIGQSAFGMCELLTNVVIPDSVAVIGSYAFYHCCNLTEMVIGDGVSAIENNAFHDCRGLNQVVIGESVTTIGYCAFCSCTSLKSVFYQGAATISSSYIFEGSESLQDICVSPAYQSTSFCEINVTSTSNICTQFRGLFSNCYKGTFKNGRVVSDKRYNATEWEKQNDGCFEHQCNDEGGLVKWSLCNTTTSEKHVCVSGQCTDGESFTEDKWAVEIELNDVKAIDLNVSEVISEIVELTGINGTQIIVGIEIDENGYASQIIAYVNSEEAANIISKAMEGMKKGEGCKFETICRTKSIKVKWIRSISDGVRIGTNIICMLIMFLVVFHF